MKNFSFMAILLCTLQVVTAQCPNLTIFNQQEIFISASSNNLSIYTHRCDICLYGVNEFNTCNCHRMCEEKFDGCVDNCIAIFSDLAQLAACIEGCIAQQVNCKNQCAGFPTQIRQVSGYAWSFNVYHTPPPDGPGDISNPFESDPSQQFASPFIAANSVPPILSGMLIEDWSEIIGNENYCAITRVRVFYTDGTCCDFIDWFCEFVG